MRTTRQLLTVAIALAGLAFVPAIAEAKAAKKRPSATRDVLVVSNNWEGTADLVNPRKFKRIARINVIPDAAERVAEINGDPAALAYFNLIRELIGEGHNQYVDDGFTSPDGRTVYFSRPSFADVVAISLKTGKIRWRTPVAGYRADHMAISEDGKRLLVSASTANVIHVINTATGEIITDIPSGDAPHENNFSNDGSLIFHASIGTVYTPTDDPLLDDTKGDRVFEVIDGNTYEVLKRIDMGQKLEEAGYPNMSAAVRPMAISPTERFVYFQVSFFFGIVKYDLREDKVVDVLDLPLGDAEGVDRTEFLLDSAHHGLAINRSGKKLCVAGTMSNYGAIVRTQPFELQATSPVGHVPYWSAASEDGKHCFVSVAGDDRVAVLSFRTGEEVASIPTGDHPQRMRLGELRRAYVRKGLIG